MGKCSALAIYREEHYNPVGGHQDAEFLPGSTFCQGARRSAGEPGADEAGGQEEEQKQELVEWVWWLLGFSR